MVGCSLTPMSLTGHEIGEQRHLLTLAQTTITPQALVRLLKTNIYDYISISLVNDILKCHGHSEIKRLFFSFEKRMELKVSLFCLIIGCHSVTFKEMTKYVCDGMLCLLHRRPFEENGTGVLSPARKL